MTDLSQFSVQSAHFSILEKDGRKLILKETLLHDTIRQHWKPLYTQVLNYLGDLVRHGIPLPKVRETSASEKSLIFFCDYKGPNILQSLPISQPESLLNHPDLLEQVLVILKQAKDANLSLDPHIKNFVIQDGIVSYVDFTPPWTPEYFDLRLSIASSEEKEILIPFFGCMAPDVLGCHFVADFLKMNAAYQKIVPELYKLIVAHGLFDGSLEIFNQTAQEIITKERRREKMQIFLL